MTPDGGPLYTETDLGAWIKEPFNAGSALLYFLLALYHAYQLKEQRKLSPFFTFALTGLAIGGIGGTLYHAFRSSRWFLLMDFLPILVLVLALAGKLWRRVLGTRWGFAVAVLPLLGIQQLGFFFLPRHLAIQLSYLSLGLTVLVPLGFVLVRENYRGLVQVAAAAGCFGCALLFRGWDASSQALFPMGTHWLWHVFALGAVHCLILYLRDR